MTIGFYRISEVVKLVGLSKTTLWRMAHRYKQDFPMPLRLSPRRIAYSREAIDAWLTNRPAVVPAAIGRKRDTAHYVETQTAWERATGLRMNSVRTENALWRHGVTSVEQLTKMTAAELFAISGIGRRGLLHISDALANRRDLVDIDKALAPPFDQAQPRSCDLGL
jgi:predicted DNA-binding transcriptional regulator AlpA